MAAIDFSTYPDADQFEAYLEAARRHDVVAFEIGDIRVTWGGAAAETTDAVGFVVPTTEGGEGDVSNRAVEGNGTTPSLPRNQHNPRLWSAGKPPGFRRNPPSATDPVKP